MRRGRRRGPWNHEPSRPRKLLLRRDEAARLSAAVSAKGFTLVPLRLYVKGHYAKVQLAVARGRRQYDKRKRIIERETEREGSPAPSVRGARSAPTPPVRRLRQAWVDALDADGVGWESFGALWGCVVFDRGRLDRIAGRGRRTPR